MLIVHERAGVFSLFLFYIEKCISSFNLVVLCVCSLPCRIYVYVCGGWVGVMNRTEETEEETEKEESKTKTEVSFVGHRKKERVCFFKREIT